MYRKYILEKNWSKTIIPALSSGQTKNDTPILGCRHQLDDHNRNPNMNNRDHLVGRLTNDDDDDDDDDGAHLRDDRIKGEGVLYCKLEKKWVG